MYIFEKNQFGTTGNKEKRKKKRTFYAMCKETSLKNGLDKAC
jgi:hypothetical protein